MSKLLVYEKKPLNAALLARATGLELSQVRSLKQLSEALVSSKPVCIALEVKMHELTSAIRTAREVKCQTGAAVIAMPESAAMGQECLLYEAGVDLVFWSMRDRNRVQRLVRAKLAGVADPVGEESTLKTRLWDRLPWKRHATGGSR